MLLICSVNDNRVLSPQMKSSSKQIRSQRQLAPFALCTHHGSVLSDDKYKEHLIITDHQLQSAHKL